VSISDDYDWLDYLRVNSPELADKAIVDLIKIESSKSNILNSVIDKLNDDYNKLINKYDFLLDRYKDFEWISFFDRHPDCKYHGDVIIGSPIIVSKLDKLTGKMIVFNSYYDLRLSVMPPDLMKCEDGSCYVNFCDSYYTMGGVEIPDDYFGRAASSDKFKELLDKLDASGANSIGCFDVSMFDEHGLYIGRISDFHSVPIPILEFESGRYFVYDDSYFCWWIPMPIAYDFKNDPDLKLIGSECVSDYII